MPTITETVKALRKRLGDTQQQFAVRLGLAISTVVRYESTRAPHGAPLRQLYELAIKNEFHDIARMFQDAIMGEVVSGLATGHYQDDDQAAALAGLELLIQNYSQIPEAHASLKQALQAISQGCRILASEKASGNMVFMPRDVALDEVLAGLTRIRQSTRKVRP